MENRELQVKKKRFRFKKGLKSFKAQSVLTFILCLVTFLVCFPFLMTVLFSLKDITDFDRGFWAFPKKLMFSNYSYGFTKILPNMLNSIAVGAIVAVVAVILSAFTSFIFVQKSFFGDRVLFLLIISMMMIPGVLQLTPKYLMMVELNLRNTWWALILPWVASNSVGGVFLFTTFMGQQPKELFESAKIDGAGDFTQFFHIALPLSVPIIMIQLTNLFSGAYNDYMWSLLVITSESKQMLMPVLNLLTFDAVLETGNAGIKYAMFLLSGIPLMVISSISLKYFINGDFASGLKL